MIQAEGAPVEQGRAQGRSMRREIEHSVRQLRQHYGWASWIGAKRRAQRTSGRVLRRQLPQQRERLEGLAFGAGVSAASLLLAEELYRVQAAGSKRGTEVHASFEIPLELEPSLTLRASRPDAGGFASVELVCAPLTGCLAGVNSEGIAVVSLADRNLGGVSVRFLAQELIFRSRQLGAAVDHIRRRAAYLQGTGRLLVADSEGSAVWLDFAGGSVKAKPVSAEGLGLEPELRIDTAARSLVWTRPGAGELRASA